MKSDFRQRVLVPLALPLLALAAIITVAFSLSRVLLAVPATGAVFIAIAVAGYVLFLAFAIERRPRISSRALAVGMAVGLVATIGAGVVAAAAGPRPVHEEETAGAEGEGAPAGESAPAEVPEDAVVFAAGNEIAWIEAPETIPAGTVTIALELEGLGHNVVFEGVNNDEPIVEGASAGVFTGTVDLEPGTYRYYCSVPGHEAGMSGEVVVE